MGKDLDDNEILERIKPYEVEYLYKYRTMASKGLGRVFTHNEVFFSDPTTFNDPFDCRPFLVTHNSDYKRKKFFEQLVKDRYPYAKKHQIKKEVRSNPRFHKFRDPAELEKMYNQFLRGFGVYCLSEIPADILMWAHYSDSHRGICLQLKADKELSLFWEAFKVRYQENYPIVNIMEMGKRSEFLKALATKSNHWEYEQERRIIKTPQEGGPRIYRYSPELLTGVILGALISDDDESRILSWVNKHTTPVTIYKAKLNKREYRLDIEGIS